MRPAAATEVSVIEHTVLPPGVGRAGLAVPAVPPVPDLVPLLPPAASPVASNRRAKTTAGRNGKEGIGFKLFQDPMIACSRTLPTRSKIRAKRLRPWTTARLGLPCNLPVRHLAYCPVCSALWGMTMPITPPVFQVEVCTAAGEEEAGHVLHGWRSLPPAQMP